LELKHVPKRTKKKRGVLMTKRSRTLFVLAAVAGTAIAGGIVYATIPDAGGVIHGCYGNNGKLRVIDTDAGETCNSSETALNWNQTGPEGPEGPEGPQGPAGAGETYFNGNFQSVPLAPFPGVTVATLSLPPGRYMMHAKFRYQGTGGSVETASCVFQGDGIGGLDGSQNNVPTGGAATGQIDAYLMDKLRKNAGDDPDVHVQCFGPPDVHIINTQFSAVVTTIHLQPQGFDY
jgi:hypothetical protein